MKYIPHILFLRVGETLGLAIKLACLLAPREFNNMLQPDIQFC